MSEESRSPRQSGQIRPWIRIGLALASLGSGTIGYFAIMRPDTPEVGGVSFVGLAAIFGVLAVVGRVPYKVNAAGVALEFPDAEKIAEAAEDLPKASRVRLAQNLRVQAGDTPTLKIASDAILAGAEFESLVLGLLEAAGWVDEISSNVRAGDGGVDVVIRVRDLQYAVMIKATRRAAVAATEVARLQMAVRSLGVDGALIIVPDTESNVDALLVLHGVLVIPLSRIDEIPGLVP
jgi:hypothetical protein